MCQFAIRHTTTPDAIYSRAQNAIRSAGGTLEGNTETGTFNLPVFGSAIVGRYRTTPEAIEIEITDKPFLVTCGLIQQQLEQRLGG